MNDPNKTMPPRRCEISDSSAERTMPGKRDRKPDGRFEPGDLILGRYKVLSELGQGGMGVVYKCFDETGGIEVALKVMPPELSHNTLEMEDIRDNFQLVAKLVHQNIAISKQLERDNSNGNYYLIMECVEGENLRQWIKQKRRENALTLETVLPIIRQVADALDYAHDQKIIHRDIKPGNIMIDSAGHVKVLDFGLAAQIHTSMTRISMAYHGTSGTGPYMAPEQWEGRVQGAAADQYSLAVMTYEMLAGHLPFESSDAAVLREAVLKSSAVPIDGITKSAWNAIQRAMNKEPRKRFDCCSNFVNALAGKMVTGMNKRRIFVFFAVAFVILFVVCGIGGLFYHRYQENLRIAEGKKRIKDFTSKAIMCFNNKDYTNAYIYGMQADKFNPVIQCNLGWLYDYGEGISPNDQEALKWYRKAADQGYARAQNNLGVCYEFGRGVEKDIHEAVKWYRKAADQGYARAQNNLGVCYEFGQGVKKDIHEAVKWYRKAVDQGDATAQCNLGNCYALGQGVEKDIQEAVKLYLKAAAQGDAAAQYRLGRMYANGRGVSKDEYEAVKWFRKAADQGNVLAQYNLGTMYEFGKGVSIDENEAVKWYLKAAAQGYADAQYKLGRCYEYGYAVKRNYYIAMEWYHKAANQGHADAQCRLGGYYGFFKKEFHEAVKWYRKAADQGHAKAQFQLGLLYDNGDGVKKNYQEAVKWYRKAVAQGYALAQFRLGYCYELGRGVGKDIQEAVMWYRKAAAQNETNSKRRLEFFVEYFHILSKAAKSGSASSQFKLGEYYEFGIVVKKDIQEAVKWYREAAAQGNKDAQKRLKQLGH